MVIKRNYGERPETISKKEEEKLFNLVNKIKPRKMELIFLTYTGSRVFGWGSSVYDIDVHGIFVYPNWFDYVHTGETPYDMTWQSLNHKIMMKRRLYFNEFLNDANPIYVHPHFDYEGMMNLASPQFVVQGSLTNQYNRFKSSKDIRTALHTYRVILCRYHFIKTGEIEPNVLNINEQYGLDYWLPKLCDMYANRNWHSEEFDWVEISNEIDDLYEKACEKIPRESKSTLDSEDFDKWKQSMRREFY